jgi:epsilon-lactone hydrolase
LAGKTLETNAKTDVLVNRAILNGMVLGYLGASTSPSTPLVNPLKANFRGFPPLYVNAGSIETLLDDAVELARIAGDHGVDVELSIAPNMQHVFPCLAGRAIEADQELDKIARWYQTLKI